MKVYCEKCKNGDINFWGYDECWKDNKEIDIVSTRNTAIREKQAKELNKNNDCKYYNKDK